MHPILLLLFVGIFLGICTYHFLLRKLILPLLLERERERIKRDVLEKSRAVIKGKVSEQILPLLPFFDYNLADVRFLGSPVDYIVFDGYTRVKEEGKGEIKIVFLEVKRKGSKLSKVQKQLKESVEKKRVEWKLVEM